MKINKYLVILLLLAGAAFKASAQTDTVNLSTHRLVTANLKPGLKQYLVYFQAPAKPKSMYFSLWLRNISIEKRNGEDVFVTNQHWYSLDTAAYRTFRSVNRRADFAPIYHAETAGGKLKAYNWGDKKITGADTVANNAAKDFAQDFDRANLNWNLDIETFEMLPLAAGKTFVIYFYDAGLTPPKYVDYKVTGSEVITLSNNQRVDCWKLYTEGKQPNGAPYSETFWISKKDHEFLMEEDKYNGMYRYKMKLPGTAPDILKRFNK